MLRVSLASQGECFCSGEIATRPSTCFFRLNVSVSSPVAVTKHADKTNLIKERFALAHSDSPREQGSQGCRGLKWLVTFHPQSERREERILAVHLNTLLFIQSRVLVQGMVPPTVGKYLSLGYYPCDETP